MFVIPRFYWFINVGSLIAYTGVAYIQQEVSFAWGFFVPLISMVIAIIIFIAAQTLYIHKPPGGKCYPVTVHPQGKWFTGRIL